MKQPLSEMEKILHRKAGELVARQVHSPVKPENQLILSFRDDRGFGISFNLTWSLRNTTDIKSIFAVIEECQKELARRGLNRAS